MPAEKATALVIRTVEFSETSLVVTLFTREFGKIGALAKGGRRLKGPFESALDLLALCRIVFLRKASDALDLLTEAKLLRRFRPPGRHLGALYAAYYVAELLDDLTDQYDPHPDLFDLADETLAALAAGVSAPKELLHFELTALRQLGHAPSLTDCVSCGRPVPTTGRASFGLVEGGVLCAECRPGHRNVASVSEAARRTMIQLAEQGENWKTTVLDARTLAELRGVLNNYMSHLLGRKPRMLPYLSTLGL